MNSAGYQSLNNHCRGFSGGPVVRGPGLIPDPGAKILQAMWHSQKNFKIPDPTWDLLRLSGVKVLGTCIFNKHPMGP